MDARKYIAEMRDAVSHDNPDLRMDAKVMTYESRLLWPTVGTQEYVDLTDLFAMGHRVVYPEALAEIAGANGITIKKKG
jgi:hypothetical protein